MIKKFTNDMEVYKELIKNLTIKIIWLKTLPIRKINDLQ